MAALLDAEDETGLSLSEHTERVAADPSDATAALRCARAHLESDLPRAAIKHAEAAEAAGVAAADACELLVAAHVRMGKRKKALQAAARGLTACGDGAAAQRERLEALRRDATALVAAAPAPAPAPSRAPRPIPGAAPAGAGRRESGKLTSAWNSKATWEEIELTDWAAESLGELLEARGGRA